MAGKYTRLLSGGKGLKKKAGSGAGLYLLLNPGKTSRKDKLRTIARGAAQGLLFDYADEAEAKLKSLFSKKSYDDIHKEVNRSYKKDAKKSPILYYGSGIASGLVPILGTANKISKGLKLTKIAKSTSSLDKLLSLKKGKGNKLKNIGKIAGTGAVYGGVSGTGASEKKGKDRLKDFKQGAGFGALFNTGLFGASKTGKVALSKALNKKKVKDINEKIKKSLDGAERGESSAIKKLEELGKEAEDKKNFLNKYAFQKLIKDNSPANSRERDRLSKSGRPNEEHISRGGKLYGKITKNLTSNKDDNLLKKSIKILSPDSKLASAKDLESVIGKEISDLKSFIKDNLPYISASGVRSNLKELIDGKSYQGASSKKKLDKFIDDWFGTVQKKNKKESGRGINNDYLDTEQFLNKVVQLGNHFESNRKNKSVDVDTKKVVSDAWSVVKKIRDDLYESLKKNKLPKQYYPEISPLKKKPSKDDVSLELEKLKQEGVSGLNKNETSFDLKDKKDIELGKKAFLAKVLKRRESDKIEKDYDKADSYQKILKEQKDELQEMIKKSPNSAVQKAIDEGKEAGLVKTLANKERIPALKASLTKIAKGGDKGKLKASIDDFYYQDYMEAVDRKDSESAVDILKSWRNELDNYGIDGKHIEEYVLSRRQKDLDEDDDPFTKGNIDEDDPSLNPAAGAEGKPYEPLDNDYYKRMSVSHNQLQRAAKSYEKAQKKAQNIETAKKEVDQEIEEITEKIREAGLDDVSSEVRDALYKYAALRKHGGDPDIASESVKIDYVDEKLWNVYKKFEGRIRRANAVSSSIKNRINKNKVEIDKIEKELERNGIPAKEQDAFSDVWLYDQMSKNSNEKLEKILNDTDAIDLFREANSVLYKRAFDSLNRDRGGVLQKPWGDVNDLEETMQLKFSDALENSPDYEKYKETMSQYSVLQDIISALRKQEEIGLLNKGVFRRAGAMMYVYSPEKWAMFWALKYALNIAVEKGADAFVSFSNIMSKGTIENKQLLIEKARKRTENIDTIISFLEHSEVPKTRGVLSTAEQIESNKDREELSNSAVGGYLDYLNSGDAISAQRVQDVFSTIKETQSDYFPIYYDIIEKLYVAVNEGQVDKVHVDNLLKKMRLDNPDFTEYGKRRLVEESEVEKP